ncbi:MAG: SRPBCC family protein [Actinomycetota bacterium]|nr:SRPBCC family protein [Actinomycetota bacterium]
MSVRAVVPGGDPGEVFDHVADFERYPEVASNVIDCTVTRNGETAESSWRVTFRNGILRWSERDVIDRANQRIGFEQTDGDLALFEGEWRVHEAGEGSLVEFVADFDLGIPTLASMLDPVAARTLASNMRELIVGFARAAGAGQPNFEEEAIDG